MCGLAGFVAKKGNQVLNSIISKMTDMIHHRGPDDEGFMLLIDDKRLVSAGGKSTPKEVWESKTEYSPSDNIANYSKEFSRLAFGHKRLSILDLTSAGHQPMSYRNGKYWIIYNGEIYNFLEINAELKKSGHQFNSKTDTETIIAAYSEWGEACLDKFVGMWAFAIYDRDADELFMARDRYGIKPLYYYFSPDGDFYFASEIKQFTQTPGWQSRMNSNRVYDQLVYSFADHTDETMFAGVFQLPGGTCYRSSLNLINPSVTGRIRFKKWYFLNIEPYKGNFTEAVGEFRNLFRRSVREHLYADVPVGTALSGGLDSSSIVCEINRILNAEGSEALQKTFSSCSVDERYSEKKWMDIVINQTNIDASFVYPQLEESIDMTSEILWHHDEPYQSQSAFLGYQVFNMAKNKGVKVLLNGQGADEYLGGYGQFTIARYANLVKYLRIAILLTDMKNLRKLNGVSYSSLFSSIAYHMLPTSVKRVFSEVKTPSRHIKELIDINRLKVKPVHPYDNIPAKFRTVSDISEHYTFFSTLPKYLHWEDRNSMAHSVEARVPFLDHRLVEFAYSLPNDFHEKNGINKRIMRHAMDGLIPDRIKNRKDKMGFTTPEERWIKKDNPALFRSKISEAIDVTDGIIKPEALKYFDNIINERLPFDYTYWRIILFSEWIKKFQVKY